MADKPAKWKLKASQKGLQVVLPISEIPVATILQGPWESEQFQFHARLIRAAPDMLEALENLENDAGQMPASAWELVQNAIRKAKGETP